MPKLARLSLLLALLLSACASAPPPRADASLIAALTAQAVAWDEAIVHKDRAAIAANMSEQFRQIDSRGSLSSKAEFLENLTSPKLTIDPYGVDGQSVRVYADIAILSGETRLRGRYDGHPFTTHYRYTDIYAREGEAWKVISVQVTEIAE